jgi:hypothetical protein
VDRVAPHEDGARTSRLSAVASDDKGAIVCWMDRSSNATMAPAAPSSLVGTRVRPWGHRGGGRAVRREAGSGLAPGGTRERPMQRSVA